MVQAEELSMPCENEVDFQYKSDELAGGNELEPELNDVDSSEYDYYVVQNYTQDESSDDSDPEDETMLQVEEPSFFGCTLTTTSSSVLFMQYKKRYGLSDQALGDLLNLFSLHCPSPNNCISSKYMFSKQFKDYNVEPPLLL